jgi:hypothetical protein
MIELSRNRQAIFILRQPSRERFATPFELPEVKFGGGDLLQASCRNTFLSRCANVKNLSNVCHDGENGQKGCKLQ